MFPILMQTIQRDSAICFPMLGNLTINPPSYFTVFGKNIYFYGVIIGLGFILGMLYCARRSREFGLKPDDVYDLMMHVRNTVYKERGVFLEPEIIILPPEYALVDEGPDLKLNSVQVNDMSRPPEPPKEG